MRATGIFLSVLALFTPCFHLSLSAWACVCGMSLWQYFKCWVIVPDPLPLNCLEYGKPAHLVSQEDTWINETAATWPCLLRPCNCLCFHTQPYLFVVLRQSLMWLSLAWNFLFSQGWPWTITPSPCISQVMVLQTWATTPRLHFIFNPGNMKILPYNTIIFMT